MTPQLNLSKPSLTAQPFRVVARRATQERAQSQQLSASFDEQLRKKHHIGLDDDSKATTDAEVIVAKSPESEQEGKSTKLSDGESESTEGASRAATEFEGGASTDQVEETSEEAPAQVSAGSEAETTEADAASNAPVDVGQPIVAADLRPVTMRSLNRLLLQGVRPQKLADERDIELSTQPSDANEATAKEEGRTDAGRESTVTESHARSACESKERAGREAPDDQPAPRLHSEGGGKTRLSRETDEQTASEQAGNDGRAAQEMRTIEQRSKQSPIALPAVGSTRKVGEGASAEGARTSSVRDPLIGLRGIDRIAGDRTIDRAGIRPSSPQTPSRAENAEASFAMSLTRGVAAAIKQGSGSITIRLRPEALGQLKINIEMRTDRAAEVAGRNPNMVLAHFEASSAEAKALLVRAMPSLRESLCERGLDVQSLEVAVAATGEAVSEGEERPSDVRMRSGTRNASAMNDGDQDDGELLSGIHGGAEESRNVDRLVTDEVAEPDDAWVSLMAPMEVDDGSWRTGGDDAEIGWIVGRGGNAGPYQVAIEDGGAARVVVDAIA